MTGKRILFHERPSVELSVLRPEGEPQYNYDERMRILVSLAYNRAMVKLNSGTYTRLNSPRSCHRMQALPTQQPICAVSGTHYFSAVITQI